MHNFMVLEKPAASGGKVLELCRTDGMHLLSAPSDATGQRLIDRAMEELKASHGAWLNLSSGHLPDWGQQLAPLLQQVRWNDWHFAPGSYVSQRHTMGEIRRGVPLKDVPEVWHLVGRIQEESCPLNFLVLDREALDLFIDLVPPQGNYIEMDTFIRRHGDKVAHVASMARFSWECVMHYCGEVRTAMPDGGVTVVPNLYVYPHLKTFIARGDLSFLLPSTRFNGTAVMTAHCKRSYENLLEELTAFLGRKVA